MMLRSGATATAKPNSGTDMFDGTRRKRATASMGSMFDDGSPPRSPLRGRWQDPENWELDTPPASNRTILNPPLLTTVIDFKHSTPEQIVKTLANYRNRLTPQQVREGEARLTAASEQQRMIDEQQRRTQEVIDTTLRAERAKWRAEQDAEIERLRAVMLEQMTLSEKRASKDRLVIERDRELVEARLRQAEERNRELQFEAERQQALVREKERLLSEYHQKLIEADDSVSTVNSETPVRSDPPAHTTPPPATTTASTSATAAKPVTTSASSTPTTTASSKTKPFKENPGDCNGKDWDVYKLRFLACRKANKWSDDDAVHALLGKLKDDALNVFRANPNHNWTFDELWAALVERYEVDIPTHLQEDVISLLYQKPGQSLQSFMDEIVKEVYHRLSSRTEERRVALTQFRRGLSNIKIKNHLAKNESSFTDIHSAYLVARKYQNRKLWDEKPPSNARVNAVASAGDEKVKRELQNTISDLRAQVDRQNTRPRESSNQSQGGYNGQRQQFNGNRRGNNRNRGRRNSYAGQGHQWAQPSNQPPPMSPSPPFASNIPPTGPPMQQQQPAWQSYQTNPQFHHPQQYPPSNPPPPDMQQQQQQYHQQPPPQQSHYPSQSNQAPPLMQDSRGNVPSMTFTPSAAAPTQDQATAT